MNEPTTEEMLVQLDKDTKTLVRDRKACEMDGTFHVADMLRKEERTTRAIRARVENYDGLVEALRACVEYMEFKADGISEPYPLDKARAALIAKLED